jgi:transcriptional regulator with XRE-family HTH domain
MDKTDSVFGSVISKHRKALGISQERLADEAGLHRTYISLIERGQRTVSLDTIIKLAKALGVTAAELLSDFENHPEQLRKG